jgi:hypothetical protein
MPLRHGSRRWWFDRVQVHLDCGPPTIDVRIPGLGIREITFVSGAQ